MPQYGEEAQNIKLPTKERLNMLIANASQSLALKLTLSMETGLRPVELCRLKVKDLDTDHKAINPITAKHGNARTLKKTNNPLFFYSVSCLTVMSHSTSLRAPIHQNARGE